MKIGKFIRDSFQKGTHYSRYNILAAAFLGAPAHISFYYLYKHVLHIEYDNLALRFTAVALCLVGLFKIRFPEFLGKYYAVYWHTMLIFVLPFIITVMLIKNNFNEAWLYYEVFVIFVLIAFVPNILIFLFDLFVGIGAAVVFSLLTPPTVVLDPQFNILAYAVVLVFSIVAGYVFSYSNQKGIVAQEKNTVLEALAGSIAHEMRNPLGQVKYSFESILQELPVYHRDKIYESITTEGLDRIYLQVAQGQMAVTRGVQVIEMILDEVKNKKIEKEGLKYLSIRGVTRKALEEYGYDSDSERQKISCDCKDDFLIKADETMYVFVLFNLIMNAFYFIKPYPEARIFLRFEKGNKFNRIYVKDTGPGIPPENIGKLFDAFFTAGKKGGTGLGLAYCKRVMKAFGGDIICNSVHGEYTEFVLSFPVVTTQEFSEFRKSMVEERIELFKGKRILLVDDEAHDRETIISYLEPLEVVIDEAGNGHQAIEMMREKRYDAVLMNLKMPVMDGYEAAEAIRAGKAGSAAQNVPVIGHTATPNYIAKSKVEKVGMDGFISKPVYIVDLIDILASVLDRKVHRNGSDSAMPNLNVLVVDDSAMNRSILKSILEKNNITTTEAENGLAAIEKLKQDSCNLVLMDMQMPELDGLETTRYIRNNLNNGHKHVPIIGLSGESDTDSIKEALDSGMNDYLEKPVNSTLLMSKINHWIKPKEVQMFEEYVDNIAVTPPYYALENLSIEDNVARAEFSAEQPMENETGTIAAAEVGRHLAVLGACALSSLNPEKDKHYYLATSAELTNVSNGSLVTNGRFIGEAKALEIKKREGKMSATVTTKEGVPVYTLVTNYFIVNESVFAKLFKDKKQLTALDLTDNSYKHEFPLSDIVVSGNTLQARLGPLDPKDCAGHFASYPCIPVAILMHALSRSAGKLLLDLVGDETLQYKVLSADVKADRFAFAGDQVQLTVTFNDKADNDYAFTCIAGNGKGKQYGSMKLKLRTV